MSLKKKIIGVFCAVIAVLGTVSCSFQNNSINGAMVINDISVNTEYVDIINQGYMGGALIYNEKDISLGQLAENVTVAIRLSKAQRYDINDTESVFQEQEGSAVYGILMIDKIDSSKISLRTELYDNKGNIYSEKVISVGKNEYADLNDDGIADIQYIEPSSKRNGYEKAMYLNFLSSQEDLNITMYAVLPEQYPGKTYPNGIIGVNNDNRFIVQKYINSETGQRSVITGVYKGDYVVDNANNKYQKIINNQYARHVRSVNDEDLVDLESEIDFDNTIFLFTEKDFAFSAPEDFLCVFPEILINKYSEFSGIEKLNKMLEDKELFKIIDESQGSILPENGKEEIFNQFDFLTTSETIQLNRVFLEKNYPASCPQRVTVSTVITEVLSLSNIVFTESVAYENIVEESSSCDTEIAENVNRAASASFSQCKTKSEYQNKLNALEKDFDNYKKLFSKDTFKIPIYKDETVNAKLSLKDSKIAIGIKGSFSTVWGSVKSSLGAAAFFKASADIDVDITETVTNDNLSVKYEGIKTDSQTKQITKTLPIIKKDITLCEFELCQSINVANFAIGPIVIGINLDLGIGLPIKTSFEMDCKLSYSAYIAGLAKAGISVGVDYGIRWKRVWFIKIPVPYTDWSGNASASANAICYYDQNFETFDFELSKLALQFSIEPYIKAGLSMSVAAVVHAGFGIHFGVKGYANFGYYAPYLRASYGLDDASSIYANVYLGLKGVKILGISIGNLGYGWNWDLFKDNRAIIPETVFFEYKLN